MGEDTLLYRKEFYVLWDAGKLENNIEETVFVCSVSIDDGDTTIIRVFDSAAGVDTKAEDKFLEWLPEDPYVCVSNRIDIEIISSHSPRFSFSKTFTEMKFSLEEQQKEVNVEFKIVRMFNVLKGEEEADENKNGLREMKEAHIHMMPVSGQDWQYLRQILRHKQGIDQREKTCRKVRKSLRKILKMPQDAESVTDAELSHHDSMTDATQTEYSDSSGGD